MSDKKFISSYIASTGSCAPEKVITNSYFESYLETSDQWITERTGIKERRWVEDNVGVSVLAEKASRQAIERAGLDVSDIDGIIFGTITSDHKMPTAACTLQEKLGIKGCFAFDISAACAGFVYSLVLADSYIASGRARNILIVGADILSSVVDMHDRNTCVLFGDAAGAAVVRACDKDLGQAGNFRLADFKQDSGIYSCEMYADGGAGEILMIAYGTACRINQETVARGEHFVKMDGKNVFKFAVKSLTEVAHSVCARAGIKVSDIDFLVTHQANMRILQAVGEQLGLPSSKIPSNIARYGNTSAATVPLLLDEEVMAGRIQKGDLVLLTSVGGGMVWGGALVRM